MTDDKLKGDEEYHYPNEEYVVEPQPEHEEAPAPTKSEPAALKFLRSNKRLVVVVALVIVAIIAFQVMKYNKNNKVISKAPVAAKVAKPKATVNSSAVQTAMVQQSLSNLREHDAANAQTISTLQSKLSGLQDQMTQANQTNAQLRQAMVLLLGQLKQMNTQMKHQPKPVVKKPSGPPSPKLTYAIRAMVDGRAWIKGSNGLTESVAVGDPIPGFGQVRAIDAVRGAIVTSSGKIIRLGLNDY